MHTGHKTMLSVLVFGVVGLATCTQGAEMVARGDKARSHIDPPVFYRFRVISPRLFWQQTRAGSHSGSPLDRIEQLAWE